MLVTPIEEVKGGRGARFIELERRGEENRVSKTANACFEKTTHQACL
jgi:hypothetical protein